MAHVSSCDSCSETFAFFIFLPLISHDILAILSIIVWTQHALSLVSQIACTIGILSICALCRLLDPCFCIGAGTPCRRPRLMVSGPRQVCSVPYIMGRYQFNSIGTLNFSFSAIILETFSTIFLSVVPACCTPHLLTPFFFLHRLILWQP